MANSSSFGWVTQALSQRRTLKTWLRCSAVLVACLVLMVDNSTSLNMGQAAFFIIIVPIMLPPNLALSVFFLAAATLLLGMLVGWGWGCAAMISAVSIRDQARLSRQQQALQSSLVPGISMALQIHQNIFEGLFLDPRSSAVYGVFFVVGIFMLGAMRAYYPSLTYLSIFGTIVLDVICTMGPSLPDTRYLIAKPFILPTCYYLAIALAGLVLIFPESLNHIWLTTLKNEFWLPTKELLALQSEALESKPSQYQQWADRTGRGRSLRLRFILASDTLLAQVGLMNLDISVGRLGPADLKRLSSELKSMMFCAGGLQSFQGFVHEVNLLDRKLEEGRHPKLSHFASYRHQVQRLERQHNHDLDTLMPILDTASSKLRKSCEIGVEATIDWLQACNGRRWTTFILRQGTSKNEEHRQKIQAARKLVGDALNDFLVEDRAKILEPYARFFDPATKKPLSRSGDSRSPFAMRSLFICFVFLDTLEAFSKGLIKTLDLMLELDQARPTPRVWFPGRVGRVQNAVQNGDFGATDPLAMGTSEDPTKFKPLARDDDEESIRQQQKCEAQDKTSSFTGRLRDPDAFPPRTRVGKGLATLGPLFRFFSSPEGIFSLRLTIVSVALWIPSVFPATAWFYYTNKGLWALITAQTALAVYAGDQIAGFFVRFVGTGIGLLIGMAVWYIGAGTGPGNPYGIVAATTVLLAPFMLARIACPREQQPLWIMAALTIVFVVGYSWINANHPTLGNPGIGIHLGWKRALLVVVGFAAGFLVMLFPNPNSSRVLVRKSLAAVNSEIGDIFASEVEAFLSEYSAAQRDVEKKEDPADASVMSNERPETKDVRTKAIALRVMTVAARLRSVQPSLVTARWEPHISGRWPSELYEQLFDLQSGTLGALVLLVTSFSKLDTRWCTSLIHKTPLLNPYFLSDLFTTISVLSGSLMSGQPLPPCLPRLRDRLVYHDLHTMNMLKGSSNLQRPVPIPSSDSSSTETSDLREKILSDADDILHRVDGVNAGLDDFTLDTLTDPMLPAYCTAIVGLLNIIGRIDDITDTVRALCGEAASMRGYDMLQEDYLSQREKTVGT